MELPGCAWEGRAKGFELLAWVAAESSELLGAILLLRDSNAFFMMVIVDGVTVELPLLQSVQKMFS